MVVSAKQGVALSASSSYCSSMLWSVHHSCLHSSPRLYGTRCRRLLGALKNAGPENAGL